MVWAAAVINVVIVVGGGDDGRILDACSITTIKITHCCCREHDVGGSAWW